MKTAVIYARYSSDNQTEQSIEGQLRVCEEFAKNNNIIILDTYIDRAMTGTNDLRPDFQRMLKDSKKKEWDYVLVYKLDRFSRDKYETTIHKKTLRDNGIKLLSAMERIPDSPEGIILESLLEGMNQYYSAELSQKVKRGMRETRLKGNFQGGNLLYGYKLDGRKIVPDENAQEIVQYIFEQFANGIYVKDIIHSLTIKGIKNRNKPFARNTVYSMLRNEKYIGIYRHEDEIIDNMYPQIISKELFEKVREKTRVNLKGSRSVKTTYLLRNKLICGYCGMPITSESGTTRLGNKIYYYKCSGRKTHHNNCNKKTLRKDILEEFVLEQLITKLSEPNIQDIIVNGLIDIQKTFSENNKELNLLLKEKKKCQDTLNNLLKAVEQGVVNKTTNTRMQELESQLEEIEKEILIEKSKSSIYIPESEIRKFYKEALKRESLMLINYIVKEIRLYNDKIDIILNSPTFRSPDCEGFLFCSVQGKIKHIIQNKPLPIMKDILIRYYV